MSWNYVVLDQSKGTAKENKIHNIRTFCMMRAAVLMVSPNRRNLQVKDRPRPRKSSTKILWCSWCLLYAFPCHVLQWSIAFCLAESLCLQFCMNMSLFDEQLPTEEITAKTRHVAKPWQLLSNDSSNLNGRWPTWSTKYNKLRNFLSETDKHRIPLTSHDKSFTEVSDGR